MWGSLGRELSRLTTTLDEYGCMRVEMIGEIMRAICHDHYTQSQIKGTSLHAVIITTNSACTALPRVSVAIQTYKKFTGHMMASFNELKEVCFILKEASLQKREATSRPFTITVVQLSTNS